MLTGNRWNLTEAGIAAVEAYIAAEGQTMSWFWKIRMKRPQSNWDNVTGKNRNTTSANTIINVLATAKLPEDPKYFIQREVPARSQKSATSSQSLPLSSAQEAPALNDEILWNLPDANPFFLERDNLLAEIAATLASDNAALIGMAGIGKTQTAIAYARRFRDQYCGIYWLGAESVAMLVAELARLAPTLKPPVPVDARQEVTARAVRAWFAMRSGWLLILDNADDPKPLIEYLPPRHNGRLLFTTRVRVTGKLAQTIALTKFDPDGGAFLLLRRAKNLVNGQGLDAATPEDRAAARAISIEVDGLPLALDAAGAYLEAKPGCAPQEYTAAYQQRGLELLDAYADRDHDAVSTTFSLALQQIERIPEIGRAAAAFARQCAFLAPDAIPEELFTSGHFTLDGLPAPLSETAYQDVRAAVLACSLLSHNRGRQTLSMHRLVQEVIRQAMTEAERREMALHAIRAVSAVSPDGLFPNWPRCARLLPHWNLCEEHIAEYKVQTQEAAYLLRQMGTYFSERFQLKEAEAPLRRSLEIYDALPERYPMETAFLCNNLATLYVNKGAFLDARKMLIRTIELLSQAPEADQAKIATALHNLASVYVKLERYGKSGLLFRRAVAIRERDEDELLTASSVASLANVYRLQGRYAESEPLFLRALGAHDLQPEVAPLQQAAIWSNLGALYTQTDRAEDAVTLLERAIALREKHHQTESDPELARYRLKLASALAKNGQCERADAEHEQGMDVLTRVLGPEHPDTLRYSIEYAGSLKNR